jgi:hypothetical protein
VRQAGAAYCVTGVHTVKSFHCQQLCGNVAFRPVSNRAAWHVLFDLASALSAGLCAAGGPDRPLSEQWKLLDAAADLLACAPDDEILTEILMLQSELVQQVGGLIHGMLLGSNMIDEVHKVS